MRVVQRNERDGYSHCLVSSWSNQNIMNTQRRCPYGARHGARMLHFTAVLHLYTAVASVFRRPTYGPNVSAPRLHGAHVRCAGSVCCPPTETQDAPPSPPRRPGAPVPACDRLVAAAFGAFGLASPVFSPCFAFQATAAYRGNCLPWSLSQASTWPLFVYTETPRTAVCCSHTLMCVCLPSSHFTLRKRRRGAGASGPLCRLPCAAAAARAAH